VALRGRDADARVRILVARRAALRPRLAVLAVSWLRRGAHGPLGFRTLGDYARERLGVGARAVQEWARVWDALRTLPALRGALLRGEISWSVARLVAGVATPASDEACLASVRGRTVRAVHAMVAAVRAAADPSGDPPGTATGVEAEAEAEAETASETADADEAPSGDDASVRLRLPADTALLAGWEVALELARRMAGERLRVWECAEAMAGEALSALPQDTSGNGGAPTGVGALAVAHRRKPLSAPSQEPGLRALAFPLLGRDAPRAVVSEAELADLEVWAAGASCHALDRAFREPLRAQQALDHDLGRLLAEILRRRLHVELGFERFDRYVEERADVSPRTARRWIRIARAGGESPGGRDRSHRAGVGGAFRAGDLTALQAERVARLAATGAAPPGEDAAPRTEAAAPASQRSPEVSCGSDEGAHPGLCGAARGSRPTGARAWVAFARAVTLRRLEDESAAATPAGGSISFEAPEDVANVFVSALEAAAAHVDRTASGPRPRGERPRARLVRGLAWIVEHAIAAWRQQGSAFHDYADFERDGFRCTAPGCSARRELRSHHIVFRSAGGPDEPWNRTTLCAFHHQRGVHAGTVRCRGRAPDALAFALGVRPDGPPLLEARSGDWLVPAPAAHDAVGRAGPAGAVDALGAARAAGAVGGRA